MAKIIPDFNPKDPTPGEADLLTLFKELPEDYLVYYTINVNNSEPDFIIVGKEIGVLVVEVKDWNLDYIKRIDSEWAYLTDSKRVRNPLAQARTYKKRLLDLAKGYPINSIVCFGNIDYNDYIYWKDSKGKDISNVLDAELILFKDELRTSISRTQLRKQKEKGYGLPTSKNVYVQLLQKKLYHTFKKDSRGQINGMTEEQIKHFSCALNPQFIIDDDDPMFKALELDQILVANNIPKEHELIRGNAGTGKSIILQAKACYIARQQEDAQILLIYFNKCIKSH